MNAANANGVNPTLEGSTNGFVTVVAAPANSAEPGDACELFYTGTGTEEDPYVITDDAPAEPMSFWATGNESPHWLKDEHERTLLYGGLKYAFSYLQEPCLLYTSPSPRDS